MTEVEFRSAETIGVSFPKRTIEVVVMPYDREAVVEYRGRTIRESVAPGAFGNINTRSNRVKVNRDHDLRNVIGQALTFHPSRNEGLVAELLISKTDTQTLTLADEGLLGASAGFYPKERGDGTPGETWPARNERRLTWLWLDHIAMTPTPAYEDAQVLAVRTESLTGASEGIVVATPNMDAARALRQADLYARLSR